MTTTAIPSVYEILVRDRAAAWQACSDPQTSARLMPRLVGLGLLGTAAYATALGALQAMDFTQFHELTPTQHGLRVFTSYAGAFFGANLAALPTFYFHTLVAGVRTHGWRVSVEVMRAQATQAMVMLGVLPMYFAMGVGLLQLNLDQTWELWRAFGFVLPFLCGLPGSIYLMQTFFRLARENPPTPPAERTAAPALLTLAWCSLFAVMAPVGVIGIWRAL